jgi:two-component system response regulator AtoC
MDSIPLLVEHFLRKNNEQYKKDVTHFSAETMNILMQYHWPGNVRELENMVRRMVVLGSDQAVVDEIAKADGLAVAAVEETNNSPDLAALGADFSDSAGIDLKAISRRAAQIAEKRVIERVLHQTRWNRKEAAERLQISYKALLYKMKDNGLSERR